MSNLVEGEDYVICVLCGKQAKSLNIHITYSHKDFGGVAAYKLRFPDAQLVAKSVGKKSSKSLIGRDITWKDKISVAVAKSWSKNRFQGRTGIPLSDESKKRLSKKMTGHEVSEDARKKIGLAGMGRIPWNSGITKNDDERLESVSRKVSEWNKLYMTEEKKEKISQTLKRLYAAGYKPPESKSGFRTDLGMYFRSTWEANYARYLKHYGLPIEYETHRFPVFKDGKIEFVYISDFAIGKDFIEIKGHADSENDWSCNCKRCIRDKHKMNRLAEFYPNVNIKLMGKKEYYELATKYNKTIPFWETTYKERRYIREKSSLERGSSDDAPDQSSGSCNNNNTLG
jgi:hypothetical protein